MIIESKRRKFLDLINDEFSLNAISFIDSV